MPAPGPPSTVRVKFSSLRECSVSTSLPARSSGMTFTLTADPALWSIRPLPRTTDMGANALPGTMVNTGVHTSSWLMHSGAPKSFMSRE